MEGLLISLSLFSIFGGTTTVSADMVLSNLIFLSCPSLSCSEPVLLGRKEEIHNKNPLFQLIENARVATQCRSLLQAIYVVRWLDALEAKRSVNGFPIFTQSVWNTEGARFHSEESVLWRDYMSACLFSAVTVTFFLNSSCQICLQRQAISNFLCPTPLSFSNSKLVPLYWPSEYAVTLSPVLSKRFPGIVLMQEVPVRLCAAFSPADSMSLQFLFLPILPPNL